VVWYRYKEEKKGLTNRKTVPEFIKKFKNGKPDLEYFGSGMCANYIYSPIERDIKAYEIFPTLNEKTVSLDHIVTDAPRSFELYKEDDVDTIHLVIRSTNDDLDRYVKSMSVDYSETGLKMLPLIRKPKFPSSYRHYFFDFELVNQFNFTCLEPDQEPLINRLIRTMSSSKNCGIMIQFLFTNWPNWNNVAELAASKLSRHIKSVEEGRRKNVISGFSKNFVPTTFFQIVSNVSKLSSFIYQTGKNLEKYYHQKACSPPITLAIRGMVVGEQDDIYATVSNLSAVFSSVRFVGDHLDYFDYDVDVNRAIMWLENNNIGTSYAYEIFRNNANMWTDMRWGKSRDFVPFLCLMPEEFPIFVSLPTDSSLAVSYRRQHLKGLNYDKMVYLLGKPGASLYNFAEYGLLTNSLRENAVGISPEDLSRHTYVLGASGSGKSTLIRNLYKHLECSNYTGTLQNSSIYIDVKDEDAKLILRQCERSSFDNDKVTYLDINHMDFGVNLLELPKYSEADRETIVSRMVGHVIDMFREFYSQPLIFVRMERILRLLLFFLYSNTDNPTILDLYEIIMRLRHYGKAELQHLLRVYKKVTGPEMTNALNSLASLSKDSWTPLINRLEMFATDNYLKKKFGVKRSTIDFEKMLKPGNITIFRISDTETPKYVQSMVIMAIIIKIWFMIQYRASVIEPKKRNLVVLALDEFQKIQDLSIITSILSQAHSYNLGLILSHQNTAQITEELLETVVGNTATQIYGKVSGIDASKISKIIDPQFTKELSGQLASQPDFVFTAKTRPPTGYQQGIPIQFTAIPPPNLTLDEKDTTLFIQKMKERHIQAESLESVFSVEEGKKFEWMRRLAVEFRTREEWEIIKLLQKHEGNIRSITEHTKIRRRNKTSQLIGKLKTEGIITIVGSRTMGAVVSHNYTLAPDAKRLYFPESFKTIGRAADVDEISKKAFDFYLGKGFFIGLAKQGGGGDKLAPDMIAYNYQNDAAIAVEIESTVELRGHPEQVRFNMIKWKDLGFSECHVWSKSSTIDEIRIKLGAEAEKVTVFVDK
jgi:hypothetical protein